jgi:hypothetical protein
MTAIGLGDFFVLQNMFALSRRHLVSATLRLPARLRFYATTIPAHPVVRAALANPLRVALTDLATRRNTTYAQLLSASFHLSRTLFFFRRLKEEELISVHKRLNLAPQDQPVAILMPPGTLHVVAQWASWLSGSFFVSLGAFFVEAKYLRIKAKSIRKVNGRTRCKTLGRALSWFTPICAIVSNLWRCS